MSAPPSTLHRVAAWCAVALGFVLVAVGTRSAVRALRPESEPETEPLPRVESTARDIDEDRASVELEREGPPTQPTASVARPPKPFTHAFDEPMEKHPAYEVEGLVYSASGTYCRRLALEVVHPGDDVAITDLHFDRRASNGVDWIARFKLIKPARGTYLLRPKVTESWPYAFEPPELRVSSSVSDVRFLLRDDMEHVNVDLVVLGAQDVELPGATFVYAVAPSRVGLWLSLRHAVACEPGTGPELQRVPVGLRLNWLATAPGHRLATGELPIASGDNRPTLRLAPGWGVVLEEVSGDDAPVADVVLDGRHWGHTDPSGTTFVGADVAPAEIQVWIGARCVLHKRLTDDHPDRPLIYHSRHAIDLRPKPPQGN